MGTTVYKYRLATPRDGGLTTLELPADYKILSAGFLHGGPDKGKMCLWAQHTRERHLLPFTKVFIEVYGTGDTIPDPETLKFINTFQVDPFTLPEVYHAYQRLNKQL